MRFKIPCKKNRFLRLTSLVLSLVLSLLSFTVLADMSAEPDRSLFWSVQKNGIPAGFLLGTIHSEDPRVLDFSADLIENLKANDVFAMELVLDLHTLQGLSEYMHYPPGQGLESVIGIERFHLLEAALADYQVPDGFVSRMKPWAAMMTLSTPPPDTGFFMDLSLSLRAAGSGLKVVGLETLEQQLSFLEDMPLPMQLSLLDQAIAEAGQVSEVHDQMVDAYLENDLVTLQTLSDEQLKAVETSASEYFIESGIHARNHRMAESLLIQLESNRVFVALGALHLPGEEGLLSILRQHGFVLAPLPMPFSTRSGVSTQ